MPVMPCCDLQRGRKQELTGTMTDLDRAMLERSGWRKCGRTWTYNRYKYPLGDTAQQAGGAHEAELQLPEQEIKPNTSPVYLTIKRAFDIIASFLMLLLLSPIMLLTALAIKLEDPKGTVFYRAPRGGKNGTPFLCLNLRCMELVRRLHEILGYIRTYFCMIQTTNFHNVHFRHQNGVFPAVETG